MIIGINGDLDTCNRGFQLISSKNKRKLLIASIDMAMTPLHKCVEHKWNVIIGNDSSRVDNIVCWRKLDSGFPYLHLSDSIYLANDDAVFTDDEFNDLIKYIKTLPDGDWQAKVAEHGKTEVKGELK